MARVQAMTMSDSGEPDTLALPVPDEICQPAAMWRLDGRIAVVTGAGQGNGRAIALGLAAAAGAAVAVSDIDPDTAGEIEVAGGRAFASRVDVADRDACGRFAEETRELLGDAAILINNAGINCRKPSANLTSRTPGTKSSASMSTARATWCAPSCPSCAPPAARS
jgi:NAD(P)-dependent dehydrogenase (short-subunit alcohol dehydrogenase family)